MSRSRWLLVIPLLAVIGAAAWFLTNPARLSGDDGRIVHPDLAGLERKLGRRLFAPTWLPHGGSVHPLDSARQGAHRVLQTFSDSEGQNLMVLAQEPRTPERDSYHDRVFVRKAEAKVTWAGRQGCFVTGADGARRLFWMEKDTALVISSPRLSDQELIKIAQGIR